MRGSKVIACAMLIVLSTSPLFAAEKKRPPAKREMLACRLGTEDRHARIAVVLVGGKMNEFAYYSKWKPRTWTRSEWSGVRLETGASCCSRQRLQARRARMPDTSVESESKTVTPAFSSAAFLASNVPWLP